MEDAAASSSNNGGVGNGRTVIFKRYDPSMKNKRVSELASLSAESPSASPAGTDGAIGAAPARVLGSRLPSKNTLLVPEQRAPSRSSSYSSSLDGSPSAAPGHGPAKINNHGETGYFAAKHSESTAPGMSSRQRERERLHAMQSQESTSKENNGNSSKEYALRQYSSNPQFTESHAPSSMPRLSSTESSSSIASMVSTTSVASHASASSAISAASSKASTVHPQPSLDLSSSQAKFSLASGIPLPRSQSAMASLQQPSTLPPFQPTYRPFIPPSAYVSHPSSSASSPGVGSMGQIVGSNMANQISSAFARGLNGVNGVVNGTAPVRIPQTASNVANAVWNKLPPALQMLKDDSWDGAFIAGMNGFATNQEQAASRTPPYNPRSHSSGAIVLGGERNRDGTGYAENTHSAENSFALDGQQQSFQPAHAGPLPLSAQLRLEVANKQLALQPSLSRTDSTASTSTAGHVAKQKAPFKPGYQPKIGVWRARTDEFLQYRNVGKRVSKSRGVSKELDPTNMKSSLEEERLLRRLDKIIELHFTHTFRDDTQPSLVKSDSDRSLLENMSNTASQRQSGFRRTSEVFGKVVRSVGRVGALANGNDIRCKSIYRKVGREYPI